LGAKELDLMVMGHGRHARIAVYREKNNHGGLKACENKRAGMIGGTRGMCSVNRMSKRGSEGATLDLKMY
jgi:hypothetical protein